MSQQGSTGQGSQSNPAFSGTSIPCLQNPKLLSSAQVSEFTTCRLAPLPFLSKRKGAGTGTPVKTEIKVVGKEAPTANHVSHHACLIIEVPAEGLSPPHLKKLCALL